MIDAFLTGTAPGAGKTRVAGLYAREAIARGRTPGFLKPALTGRTDDATAAAGTGCAHQPGLVERTARAEPGRIAAVLGSPPLETVAG